MSKTAAIAVAFLGVILFSVPMSAQILWRGNAYAGVSYGQFTDVINQQS